MTENIHKIYCSRCGLEMYIPESWIMNSKIKRVLCGTCDYECREGEEFEEISGDVNLK